MSGPDPNDPTTWGLSPEMLALLNRDLEALDSPAVWDRVQGIEGVVKNDRQDAIPRLVELLADEAPVIGQDDVGEVRQLALAALQRLHWKARRPLQVGEVLVRPTWPLGEMREAYSRAIAELSPDRREAVHARADDYLARRVQPSAYTASDARAYRVLQELGLVAYQRQTADPVTLLTPLQAELYARQVAKPPPLPRVRVALREHPDTTIGWIHFDGGTRRWTATFSEHPARPDAEAILLEAMPVQGGVIRRVVHDQRGQPVRGADGKLVIEGEIRLDSGDQLDILRSYAAFLGRTFATELQLAAGPAAAKAARVANLANLSSEQIAEARAVLRESGRGHAVKHLRDRVENLTAGQAAEFVEDVLERDVPSAQTRDRVYVASSAARDLVARPLRDSLSVVESIEGERWVRPRPDRQSWISSPATGAPGVLVRTDPLGRKAPPGTIATILPADEIEPIDDLEIAGRRWIASQVASELRGRPLPATTSGIAAALGVAGPLSRDGEIAVGALLLESGLPEDDRAPGFRGPDDWFRAPANPNELIVTADEARARGLPPIEIKVDAHESGLIHGPLSRRGAFYLRLHGPPGDPIEFAAWPAADDERGADGIERSMRRVLELRRPERIQVTGGLQRVQLAGGERLAGCVYLAMPSPLPRLVTCVVLVEHAHGLVMVSFTHDVHPQNDVTPAQVLEHPRLRLLARSLRVS